MCSITKHCTKHRCHCGRCGAYSCALLTSSYASIMLSCLLVVSSRHTDALFLSLRVRREPVIRERRLSNFIVSVRWHSATSERHDRSIGRQPPGAASVQTKKNLIKRQGFFHKPNQVFRLAWLPILELTVLHWIFLLVT